MCLFLDGISAGFITENCGRSLYLQSRLTHPFIFMIMVPR